MTKPTAIQMSASSEIDSRDSKGPPRGHAQRTVRLDLHSVFCSVLDGLRPGLSQGLDEARWAVLSPLLRTMRLEAGQPALLQGLRPQAFFAVATGEIEARFSGLDGQVSVLEGVQPPRLFGLAGFVCGQASRYEAIAREPSLLIAIGPMAYVWLMDELPGFARALMQEFAGRYAGTLGLLAASRHATASQRLLLSLQQLDAERGEPLDGEPGWRRIHASQAELAALAGVSRQTVNEWLGTQARDGHLRRGYRCIHWRAARPGVSLA